MVRFQAKTVIIVSVMLLIFFALGTAAVLFPIYNASKAAYESFASLLYQYPEEAFTYLDKVKFVTYRSKLSVLLNTYRLELAREHLAAGRYTEAFETASQIGDPEKLNLFKEDAIARYLSEEDPLTKTLLRRYLVFTRYHAEAKDTDPYIDYRALAAVGRGFALSVNPNGTLTAYGTLPAGLSEVLPGWANAAAVAAFGHSAVATTITPCQNSDGTERFELRVNAFGDNSLLQLSLGSVSTGVSPSLSSTHTAVTLKSGCFVTNQQATPGWSIVLSAAGNGYTAGLNWLGRPLLTGAEEAFTEEVRSWSEIVLLSAGEEALYGLTANGVLRAAQSPFAVDGIAQIAGMSAAPGRLIVLKQDQTAQAFGYAPVVSEALAKMPALAAVYAGPDGVLVRLASGQYRYIQE